MSLFRHFICCVLLYLIQFATIDVHGSLQQHIRTKAILDLTIRSRENRLGGQDSGLGVVLRFHFDNKDFIYVIWKSKSPVWYGITKIIYVQILFIAGKYNVIYL